MFIKKLFMIFLEINDKLKKHAKIYIELVGSWPSYLWRYPI